MLKRLLRRFFVWVEKQDRARQHVGIGESPRFAVLKRDCKHGGEQTRDLSFDGFALASRALYFDHGGDAEQSLDLFFCNRQILSYFSHTLIIAKKI